MRLTAYALLRFFLGIAAGIFAVVAFAALVVMFVMFAIHDTPLFF